VPVALCRALGAESVIAVDLNAALLTRRFRGESDRAAAPPDERGDGGHGNGHGHGSPWAFQNAWSELRRRFVGSEPAKGGPPSPGLYDVLNNTLEIMQVRITRSRMAGDPPELLITPRLPDFALLDLYRASEAIEEGRRATERALATLAAREPEREEEEEVQDDSESAAEGAKI
jgi:NTE family protein